MPDTTAGRDTAYEVGDKILRGLSKEFRSVRDAFTPRKTIGLLRKRGSMALAWWTGQRTRRAALPCGTGRNTLKPGAACLHLVSLSHEPTPEFRLADVPVWARLNTYVDHKGRLIFIGGDLDCRYEDYDIEERQMPRLRGRMPYNVDGVTSMARNEHVRFLPGAFAASLDGEILALVGNNYDDPSRREQSNAPSASPTVPTP